MNDAAPTLDEAIFARYLEKLRSHGVPVDQLTVPGLSDAEIDERLAAIDLTLPNEARVFWRWRNGVPDDRPNPLGGFKGRFLSLDEAVAGHRQTRGVVLEVVEGDPDIRYAPAWLPLIGPQHPLVIDCSVGTEQPTPLRLVDLADPEEPRIRARSLGEAVQLWTDALDRGLWRWDATAQHWEVDLSPLPPLERSNPLL